MEKITQLDDAGWGCLIGGMLVGVYRAEDEQFDCGLVEPAFFQGDQYERKMYLAEAGRQAGLVFARLGIDRSEPVMVCTGHALDGVCEWLGTSGYTWQRGKITGPLQELVERALQDYLCNLGFQVPYEMLTEPGQKGLFWWHQIKWLKGGNPNRAGHSPERARQCKTGWWSFRYWSAHPYQEAKRLVSQARAERRAGHWLR